MATVVEISTAKIAPFPYVVIRLPGDGHCRIHNGYDTGIISGAAANF
jgi:hypothetical protein